METRNYSEENEKQFLSKLTPKKVVSLLAKYGTKVSAEEAEIILQFMRKIADVAVNQYLSVRKD